MNISYMVRAAACLVCFLSAPAQADIMIASTRAIYPAQDREITVKLTNTQKTSPRLVQTWIDDGGADKPPEQIDVPFAITPPIFRMDAGKSQSLRIVYTKEDGLHKTLPADKESVFWLNVFSVPPTEKGAEEESGVRFAFRTRIKLFFRPENLPGRVEDSARNLQWTLMKDGADATLEVHNPGAYHVSFASVAVALDGKEIATESKQMLAPGATERLVLKSLSAAPGAKTEVRFETIDDLGYTVPHTAKDVVMTAGGRD